ncbi:hypothetical protein BGZ68_007897, partial [Mortierella alpina]
MKNLVTVLLIATLAIASSFAAQETPQANLAVDVPASAAPSKDTIVDAADAPAPAVTSEKITALWNKKHRHDDYHDDKQCRTITLDNPLCVLECKVKCGGSNEACGSSCREQFKGSCQSGCWASQNTCKAKCTPFNCDTKCQAHHATCISACVTLASGGGGGGGGGSKDKSGPTPVDCEAVCGPCKEHCVDVCEAA